MNELQGWWRVTTPSACFAIKEVDGRVVIERNEYGNLTSFAPYAKLSCTDARGRGLPISQVLGYWVQKRGATVQAMWYNLE